MDLLCEKQRSDIFALIVRSKDNMRRGWQSRAWCSGWPSSWIR